MGGGERRGAFGPVGLRRPSAPSAVADVHAPPLDGTARSFGTGGGRGKRLPSVALPFAHVLDEDVYETITSLE